MSTGLAVFDTTVQETNEWLRGVEASLPPCSRQQAYRALRAVLQTLRDRLPIEAVLGLSARLPLLLRGVFLEGWQAEPPSDIRKPAAFERAVDERLAPDFPCEPQGVIEAVFAVMVDRLDSGEVAKIIHHLPKSLGGMWPAANQSAC
jgi:uncharacterized protein (DUF2267 family)